MSNEPTSITMEELFTAFHRTWPNVSSVMNSYQFPEDANPGLLIQRIAAASNYPEKHLFITLLNCFDYQFGALNEKTSSQALEIAELDSDLT
ncbi:putative chromosome segregation protein, partial [Erysiphe neolycopersici]